MLRPEEPFLKNWVGFPENSSHASSVLHFLDLHSNLLQTHCKHPPAASEDLIAGRSHR